MDPIQPIVPHAPNIPPIPPALGIERVKRDGGKQGGAGAQRQAKRPPAATPAAEPDELGDGPELGQDDGLPHIDVTA